MILNEAQYFSNIKEITDINSDFKIICKKCKEDLTYNPYNSKESKDIEKKLCLLFNFEKVDIHWQVSSSEVNMSTNPITSLIPLTQGDLELTQDNKGYHFKNKKDKIAFFNLDTSMFIIADLAPEEATALLLHEVGHNFFITNTGRYLKPFFYLLTVISKVLDFIKSTGYKEGIELISSVLSIITYSTKTGRKVNMNIRDIDKEKYDGEIVKAIEKVKTIGSGFITLLDMTIGIFLLPIQAIKITTTGIISLPINLAINSITSGYKNEKFADNFATMYGYGTYLASALSKLNKLSNRSLTGKIYADVPIINLYYGTLTHYIEAIFSLGDSHPTAPTRLKDQRRYLEEALNDKQVPEKYKNEIKKQIDDIENVYLNLYKEYNLSPETTQQTFYQIRKELNISDEDWKELIWRTKNYEYDKVLKERVVS